MLVAGRRWKIGWLLNIAGTCGGDASKKEGHEEIVVVEVDEKSLFRRRHVIRPLEPLRLLFLSWTKPPSECRVVDHLNVKIVHTREPTHKSHIYTDCKHANHI